MANQPSYKDVSAHTLVTLKGKKKVDLKDYATKADKIFEHKKDAKASHDKKMADAEATHDKAKADYKAKK